VARVHASIWADLARRGVAVGERDLMIGATAIAKDYAVVTRDERSFPKDKRPEGAALINGAISGHQSISEIDRMATCGSIMSAEGEQPIAKKFPALRQ
jgi:hypothetical protein